MGGFELLEELKARDAPPSNGCLPEGLCQKVLWGLGRGCAGDTKADRNWRSQKFKALMSCLSIYSGGGGGAAAGSSVLKALGRGSMDVL